VTSKKAMDAVALRNGARHFGGRSLEPLMGICDNVPNVAQTVLGAWARQARPKSQSGGTEGRGALPLTGGVCVTLISLLSLGLWAVIWGVVALLASEGLP
jgi:hypothetical protein